MKQLICHANLKVVFADDELNGIDYIEPLCINSMWEPDSIPIDVA